MYVVTDNKFQIPKDTLLKVTCKYLQSCLYEILKPENSADLSDSKMMVTLSPEEVVERLKNINVKYGRNGNVNDHILSRSESTKC